MSAPEYQNPHRIGVCLETLFKRNCLLPTSSILPAFYFYFLKKKSEAPVKLDALDLIQAHLTHLHAEPGGNQSEHNTQQ